MIPRQYFEGPAAPILGLVCGYEMRHWSEKLLIMLRAFIDDSANDGGDQRLFLAGYINTAERWIEFSQAWGEALKADPAIEYLHMVEAQNLRGQFKDWAPADRDRKVMALARVIRAHSPWSVEAAISRRDCTKIMGPSAPYGLAQPYFLCFHLVIDSVARFHKMKGLTLPVDFVFDEQGGMGNNALLFYNIIKEEHPDLSHLLGCTPVFRDDKAVVGLQAADVLAWHIRREAQFRSQKLPALEILRASGEHIMRKFQKSDLKSMARSMRKVPGVEKTQTKKAWREITRTISAINKSS